MPTLSGERPQYQMQIYGWDNILLMLTGQQISRNWLLDKYQYGSRAVWSSDAFCIATERLKGKQIELPNNVPVIMNATKLMIIFHANKEHLVTMIQGRMARQDHVRN